MVIESDDSEQMVVNALHCARHRLSGSRLTRTEELTCLTPPTMGASGIGSAGGTSSGTPKLRNDTSHKVRSLTYYSLFKPKMRWAVNLAFMEN